MIRNSWIIALVTVLALTCGQAEAQVKPFKITGGGVAPLGIPIVPGTSAPHWAVGHATHLGKYYGEGKVKLLAFTGPTTATFTSDGAFVFVAADGSRLAFTYGDVKNGAKKPGEVTLIPAVGGKVKTVWVAEFNPVIPQCTGRFAKVTAGSFIMVAVTEPFVPGSTTPVPYTWEGNGWLAF